MFQIVVYIRLLVDLLFFSQMVIYYTPLYKWNKILEGIHKRKSIALSFTPLSSLFETLSST